MYRKYRVEIEGTTEMLGTQPTDPMARKFLEEREDEEVATFPPGRLTFYQNDSKPVLMNYQVKGFFKEAAVVLPEYLGVAGRKREYPAPATIRGHIDRWLFISPRYISINQSGVAKDTADGSVVHYLRTMTRKGERVTPIESDYIAPGMRMVFTVSVLENCSIGEEGIRRWLEYGEEGLGLLAWRTAGYGHFRVIGFHEVA